MNRFRQALGVSSAFTLYIMCFYYAFAMFDALFHGTSLVQAFVNTLIAGVFIFCVLAYGLYQLYAWADERNEIERAERAERERRERLEEEERNPNPTPERDETTQGDHPR